MPKYENYKGRGDPREHIKESFMTSQELEHEDTYLICLFHHSLGGQEIEWLLHLPKGSITSFGDNQKICQTFLL